MRTNCQLIFVNFYNTNFYKKTYILFLIFEYFWAYKLYFAKDKCKTLPASFTFLSILVISVNSIYLLASH